MSHDHLGADAPPHPSRRRIGRRIVATAAAVAAVIASAVAGGAPASASQRQCHEARSSYVAGETVNTTGRFLVRTYLEKGALNFWGDQPASELRQYDGDDWCAGADAFGTAMKAVYALDDTSVTLEAWRYRPGPAGARCSVDGPAAARYRCTTRTIVEDHYTFAIFRLEKV